MTSIELKQPSVKQFQDQLLSAFEGGSNYWYQITEHHFPEGIKYRDFRLGGRLTDPLDDFHPAEIIPVTEGCALLICCEDHRFGVWLNLLALQYGFARLWETQSRMAADILTEDGDANTADCFLQMAVFGEIVYG